MNKDEDQFPKVKYERPDTTEYMMSQPTPRPTSMNTEDYYSEGGYQYGKRPKGWKK
jgi:hypothetical protein